MRRAKVQQELDAARPCKGQGGWRPGSGRPKGRADVLHSSRENVGRRYPQHVTLRVMPGVRLRDAGLLGTMHGVISDSQRSDFRIVEFSILDNHLHEVVEADDRRALAAGVTGFEVRMAQRLNGRLGRAGALFEGRFHSRSLRTPTEVRNALRYVLLNARHHADERGQRLPGDWVDPYSSAPWFDGWDRVVEPPAGWGLRRDPTAAPQSWLLAVGWRRLGALAVDDVPGRPGFVARAAGERPMGARQRVRTGLAQLELFRDEELTPPSVNGDDALVEQLALFGDAA